MKKVLFTTIALLFIIIGCQDENSILLPSEDIDEASSLNKGGIILDRKLDDGQDDSEDLFYLKDSLNFNGTNRLNDDRYDPNDGHDDYSFFKKTYKVDGKKGAMLYFNEPFTNEKGEFGILNAWLNIPSGAFDGELEFEVIFYLDCYSMELYPSPFTFKKPLSLTLFFYNVDLSPNDRLLDFAYVEGRGEDVEYRMKKVDYENGNIFVWDAQLHHFSRYGWTRKREAKGRKLKMAQ